MSPHSLYAVRTLSSLLEVQVKALSYGAPVEAVLEATLDALNSVLGKALPVPQRRLSEPPLAPEELPPSPWDPEGHDIVMEASKCRALLLEIVRRAAHDWVLYRMSRKMPEQELAEDAYIWLFEEDSSHPWFERREDTPKFITSFLTICELLDLNPRVVRERVKEMTVKSIMTAGRPAERRRRRREESTQVEDFTLVDGVMPTESLESNYDSSYEAHFAVEMCC